MNNLDAIIRGAMQIRKGTIKITHEGEELTGNRRLVDTGLVNGSMLEVETSNMEELVREEKCSRSM